MRTWYKVLFLSLLTLVLVACQGEEAEQKEDANSESGEDLKKVQLFLDWTPNTNHSGIYAAKDQGYFEEEGLDLEIMLPGEVPTEQIVATGKAEFGISFQTQVTQARAENMPVVSIVAIIQQHTGGYYTPTDKGIKTPKDFEGRVYGAYGSELEKSMLQAVMKSEGGDASKVDVVQVGNTDYFIATQRDVDFVNIFYAWTGIEGEVRGADMNFIKTIDYAPELNTYSPVIITNEEMIEQDPETVQAFVTAVLKGYEYAIENPEETADILIAEEPDLNPELVKRSQEWLSPLYQEDAPVWGTQEEKRWVDYAKFMYDENIIEVEVDASAAFTNQFIENAKK
ncbi:ABC transporter substrate-binding protein [Savagea faecisuis]|uniref:ABC transporter substrate-binding protein n=1 Tax=Savagea faecisuis TaxID=1274803 RepID=A0ABW3GTM7_9BACL